MAIYAKILWNIHTKKDLLLIKRLLTIRDQMLETNTRQEIIRKWEKWYASGGVHDAYEFFRPKGEKLAWARYVWKDVVPPKYSFIT